MADWIRALETTEGGWSAFAAAEEAMAVEGGAAAAAASFAGPAIMAVEGGAAAAAATVAAPAIAASGAALGLVAVAGTLWQNAYHAAAPSAAADLVRTVVRGHTNTGIEQLNGHNGVVQGTASGFQALPYWLQPLPQTGPQPIPIYDDTDPVTITPSSSRGHSLATHHISASQERGRGRERTRQGRSRTRDMASTIAYPARPRPRTPSARAASVAPTIAYPARAASEAPTILYPRAREEDEDATPFESNAAKRMKRSTSAPMVVRPRMRPHPRAKLVKSSQPLKIPRPKGKAKAKAKSAASASGGLPFASSSRDVGPLATKPKDLNGK